MFDCVMINSLRLSISLSLGIHCRKVNVPKEYYYLRLLAVFRNHSTAKYEPYGLIKSAVRYQHVCFKIHDARNFDIRMQI